MDESSGREIRRLRSIFWSERDPEGRAFPTLADAYRRAGDLDQALELLKDGLDRHPAFATGHVVAAWVHRDRSDLEAAEGAFRRVLELDEENVQALHGLGKILVVRGQVEEAQALLTRAAELGAATEADLARGAAPPEEPDVGAELPTDTGAPPPAAVDAAMEALPDTGMEPSSLAPGALEVGAGATPSTGEAADEAAGAEVVDIADLAPDPVDIADLAPDPVEEEAGAPSGPEEPAVVEIADLAPDHVEEEAAETPAGAEEPAVVEIADLAPDHREEVVEAPVGSEGAAVVDTDALAPDEAAAAGDDEVTIPVEIADLAPDEAAVEAAAPEEVVQEEPVQEEPVQEEPVQEEAVREEALREEPVQEEAVRDEPVQAEVAAEPPAEERAREEGVEEAPVAAVGAEAFRAAAAEPYEGPRTRTMAELYARQGLLDRAVDIYEHLVRERPQERDLRDRMEELRARRSGDEPGVEEEVEAMAREMSAGDHAEATPSPFTWADDGPSTGGAETEAEAAAEEPIAEWFGELLAWGPGPRPPEDEPPPHGDTLPVSGEDR